MAFDRRSGARSGGREDSGSTASVPGKATLTERLVAPATTSPSPRSEPASTGGQPTLESPRASIESLFGGHVVQQARSPSGAEVLPAAVQAHPTPRDQREHDPRSAHDVRSAAARGLETPSTSMPHAAAIQRSFGSEHDVSGVQAHVGGAASEACHDMNATAFAAGNHVAFASAPDLHTAAHEAAHVVQQARGVNLYEGVGEAGDGYEHHADAVADRVVAGQTAADLLSSGPLSNVPAGGRGGTGVQRKIAVPIVQMDKPAPTPAPAPGVTPPSPPPPSSPEPNTPLVAEIKKAIASNAGAAVLRKLRDTTSATKDEQQAIIAAIDGAGKTVLSDDDKWLAKRLLTGNTADPKAAAADEVTQFTDPDPDPDPGTKTPIQTEVHFVAGRTNRRALVIGGVHGSEPEGSVVVQQLVEALKNAKRKPLFTVVLVPRLIDKSRQDPHPKSPNSPYREVDDKTAKGSAGATSKGTTSEGNIEVEPNRNFQLPGKSYDTYKKEGHLTFWDKESSSVRAPVDKAHDQGKAVASEKMLPENRILEHLIERFQPERLASIHQHKLPGRRGDGPGVFVDPRRPANKLSADDGVDQNDHALTPEGKEDDQLAEAMRDAVQQGAEAKGIRKTGSDPLAGNDVPQPGEKKKRKLPPTVHYRTDAHAEGNSLGDWAPVEVKEGGAGDRPAIGTFTIELPQYKKDDKAQADALAKLEVIDVDMLLNVFLEGPSTGAP